MVYNAKFISHTVVCCRGNRVVYFKPPSTTTSCNRPWPPNTGSGPPGRKNRRKIFTVHQKDCQLQIDLGLVCTFRKLHYRDRQKHMQHSAHRRAAVICIGVKYRIYYCSITFYAKDGSLWLRRFVTLNATGNIFQTSYLTNITFMMKHMYIQFIQ